MKKVKAHTNLITHFYIPLLVCSTIITLVFPTLATYITYTAYLFAIYGLVLVISPFGKTQLEKPPYPLRYSTPVWLGLLWLCQLIVMLLFLSFTHSVSHFVAPSDYASLYNPQQLLLDWAFFPWVIYAIVGIALAYFHFYADRPFTILTSIQTRISVDIDSSLGICINNCLRIGLFLFVSLTVAANMVWLSNTLFTNLMPPIRWGIDPGALLLLTLAGPLALTRVIRQPFFRNMPIALLIIGLVAGLLIILTSFNWLLLPLVEGFHTAAAVQASQQFLDALPLHTAWSIVCFSWWIFCTPLMAFFIAHISQGRSIRAVIIAASICPLILWIILRNTTEEMSQHVMTLSADPTVCFALTLISLAVILGYISSPIFRTILVSTFTDIPIKEKHPIPSLLIMRFLVGALGSICLYLLTGIALLQILFFFITACCVATYSLLCYALIRRQRCPL